MVQGGMKEMNVTVNPHPPYDFYKMIRKLSLDSQYKVEKENRQLSFAVRIKNQREEQLWKKGIIFLTNQGTIEQPEIALHYEGEALDQAEQVWLKRHLAFRFGWSRDVLTSFYQRIERVPILAQMIQNHIGLPLVLEEGLYECLIKTIIHQQVNLRFAQQLVIDLAREFGDLLNHAGHGYALFPTPNQLAQVDVDTLRQRKFSLRKAEYITELARKIASGTLDLDALSQEDNQTIISELTKERGVGNWTAECFLLFGLGRANLFPAGDLGIQKGLQQLLGLATRPTAEVCRKWIEPYQEWGSYIALYLWESVSQS